MTNAYPSGLYIDFLHATHEIALTQAFAMKQAIQAAVNAAIEVGALKATPTSNGWKINEPVCFEVATLLILAANYFVVDNYPVLIKKAERPRTPRKPQG